MPLLIILVLTGFSNAAYLHKQRGQVDIKKTGTENWGGVGNDRITLSEGDEVKTARASTVEIYMDDGTKVKLAPLSAFKMSSETKEGVSIGLYVGRIRSWVRKFSKKFEVRTPSAVCAVRGTDFMVSADAEGNTRVEVYDGSVLTGDSAGHSALLRAGEFARIDKGGDVGPPQRNPNQPSNMDSSIGDAKLLAKKEIYNEMSKEDVIAGAQAEIQSAEFQNRKVAIDAFGNRVRMEEYVIRPAADQFKYVVLNTRKDRFDFGKILFTFDNPLPDDLSLATRNMITAAGAAAPQWQLTEMNSIMSNTLDKVTEDATGGKMIADDPANPSVWTHFFADYAFYVQGGDLAPENDGMGKKLWSFSDANMDNTIQAGELSYLGGSAPTGLLAFPAGEDTFYTVTKNTYADAGGTWIQAADFVLFDNGNIVSTGDLTTRLGESMDTVTDKLNFQRIYTSSLFNGRKIDLEFSAKLLKDAGLIRF
ncbi:MAG: FecR domain-containing protein [Elusimicrobia bacterium]|nr:FecR domain-containing protein [Elusimicrobiota bacterium]